MAKGKAAHINGCGYASSQPEDRTRTNYRRPREDVGPVVEQYENALERYVKNQQTHGTSDDMTKGVGQGFVTRPAEPKRLLWVEEGKP
jgi:hypothetical protein